MALMLITAETAPFVKLAKVQHVRSAKLVRRAKRPVAKAIVARNAKPANDNVIVIVIAEEQKWHIQLLLKEKRRLHQ